MDHWAGHSRLMVHRAGEVVARARNSRGGWVLWDMRCDSGAQDGRGLAGGATGWGLRGLRALVGGPTGVVWGGGLGALVWGL